MDDILQLIFKQLTELSLMLVRSVNKHLHSLIPASKHSLLALCVRENDYLLFERLLDWVTPGFDMLEEAVTTDNVVFVDFYLKANLLCANLVNYLLGRSKSFSVLEYVKTTSVYDEYELVKSAVLHANKDVLILFLHKNVYGDIIRSNPHLRQWYMQEQLKRIACNTD